MRVWLGRQLPAPFLLGLLLLVSPAAAQDPEPKPHAEGEVPAPARGGPAYGEDVLPEFVPLHPRTAEDRREMETLRDYMTARALEGRRMLSEAASVLQEALKLDPDSVALQRRASRLYFLLGRTEQALESARKVLEADPSDTETLSLLVNYYDRRNDPAPAEALLRKLLDNPKLVKGSPGYLLIQRDLGLLYADKLNKPQEAADALAIVVQALDEKAANKLTLADQRRLLGLDEAASYGHFGEIFLKAGRAEPAATAFRRGLVYDPDHPLLPRYLAQTLLELNRTDEALTILEAYLKRQPQGREPYELLIEVLTKLQRAAEILPRLEAAAKNDPKNLPLQYLLADRYREAGQPQKADALYRELIATQPDAQGFGALASSLVREKKTDELIELLGKAFAKPETLEAVKPQIESIVNDTKFAGELLDAALKLQEADPPKLSRESRLVLTYIATKAKLFDKLIPIQRLALKRDPNAQAYREFWLDLYRAGKYTEASETLDEMLERFPDERDPQTLAALAQSHSLAGHNDIALKVADEILKLNPNDEEGLRLRGFLLGKMGRNDDAIAHYNMMLEKFPENDEVVKLARSGLSIIYVNLEQFDKGEAELELLLERDPDDAGVNNDLGYLYADRGKNLEKAEAMIRKAVAEEPENPAYLDSLGWILYRTGKFEEAVEPLERAAKDSTTDATILDHLGDVYFKLNRPEDARQAWVKAESIAAASTPPDKRLVEIRKKLQTLESLKAGNVGNTAAPAQP